jgi:hypothetical protein
MDRNPGNTVILSEAKDLAGTKEILRSLRSLRMTL